MDPVILGSSVSLNAMVTGFRAATDWGPEQVPSQGKVVWEGQQGQNRDESPVGDGSGHNPLSPTIKEILLIF